MSDPNKPVLDRYHLTLFGGIIQLFAKVEVGFKLVLAGLINTDISTAVILSDSYTSMQLRRVVKSLSKLPNSRLSSENNEKLVHLVGHFKTFGPVRNHIAHNQWTEGHQSETIKPMLIDIRSEKPKHVGMDPDEEEYTHDDLLKKYHDLQKLADDIYTFLKDTGFDDDITKNIDASSTEILDADGNSNNES